MVVKNLNYGALLVVYSGMLTERQREILALYYWEDLSLAEIAENFGVTRQAVRDGLKHGEKRLALLEDRLGLSAKAQQCTRLFEEISKMSDINEIRSLAYKGMDIF